MVQVEAESKNLLSYDVLAVVDPLSKGQLHELSYNQQLEILAIH